MTCINRILSRSACCRNCLLEDSLAMGAARHGIAPCDCAARCRQCCYGFWPLVAAPLALVAGFSVLVSGLLLAGAAVVTGPELNGFFQPPQELHADSESTSRPARNTLRCVRFMINSSVVGVLQCVRDDAVPLQ
jgi:hypothetical protein